MNSYFLDQFSQAVIKYKNCQAASHNENSITYQELDIASNKVANFIIDHGAKKGDVIGVRLERNIDLLISMIAIFKCEAVYMPIDDGLPVERQKYIIEKSQCSFVVDRMGSKYHSTDTNIIDYDLASCCQNDHSISRSNESSQVAYIIFTSGTTGKPKGVMVRQDGMMNHIHAKVEALEITNVTKVAQTAPQSFDISIWQFLSALTTGGETIIIDKCDQVEPKKLIEKINCEKVNVIQFVPSLFHTFINDIKNYENIKFEHLNYLATVGEPLLPITCKHWFDFCDIPILNHYGPTECSDGVTHYLIRSMADIPGNVTPIGREIDGLKLYVCEHVDGELSEIQEKFKIGELYVAGIGVSNGYINDGYGPGI